MQSIISEFEHKILNKTIFSVPKTGEQGQSNKEKAIAELAAQEEAERMAAEEEKTEASEEYLEEP